MGRRGRPVKVTSETIEAIARDIRQGAPMAAAAERHGVHRQTLYNLLNQARNGQKGRASELAEAVTKAKAERVAELAQATYQAALNGDTRVALRMLEIWEPSEFPKDSIRVEHTESISADSSNEAWPGWFWSTLTEIEIRVLEVVSLRKEILAKCENDEAAYMAALANEKEILDGLAELEKTWKDVRNPWKTQVPWKTNVRVR